MLSDNNPYDFIYMERWNAGRIIPIYVAYTENGDVFLTSDMRDDIPVFSSGCKIGNSMPEMCFQELKQYQEDEDLVERMDFGCYMVAGYGGKYCFDKYTEPTSWFNRIINRYFLKNN